MPTKVPNMFDGVKVFSATMHKDREVLGETVTKWLNEHREEFEIVDRAVCQSSDREYHCLSISLFYRFKKR